MGVCNPLLIEINYSYWLGATGWIGEVRDVFDFFQRFFGVKGCPIFGAVDEVFFGEIKAKAVSGGFGLFLELPMSAEARKAPQGEKN